MSRCMFRSHSAKSSSEMGFFDGKVVIVTGSSSGIGRATAALFSKAGAKVTITGRKPAALAETKALCLKSGAKEGDIVELIGDVTDEIFLEKLVNETVKKFGTVDVLVNNAGAASFDSTGKQGIDQPVTAFDHMLNVNVRSVIRLSQLALPYLEKTKGAIVNVSSIGAHPIHTSEAYYAAAKACLDQMTVQMAGDLIKKGVRVNGVNPGPVKTNFVVTAGLSKELQDQMFYAMSSDNIPLGRMGQPEDIGKVILFLADRSQSEVIIGQRIVADCGVLMKNAVLSGL
ncbi:hypothetical protein PRIPAC_80845 [Pristionchus pacificus]|uniref:Dehydrogenase n=1 Tax=Pristionchus pacificus TaxID=54126 RepID=A0A454XSH4_PRIPA|nr:hypothetical protein PRIPAC_80845 [Pristionchus pacificus]|eukprot:PDM72927.1 dehydrogenase [Pristionchus pacificus]